MKGVRLFAAAVLLTVCSAGRSWAESTRVEWDGSGSPADSLSGWTANGAVATHWLLDTPTIGESHQLLNTASAVSWIRWPPSDLVRADGWILEWGANVTDHSAGVGGAAVAWGDDVSYFSFYYTSTSTIRVVDGGGAVVTPDPDLGGAGYHTFKAEMLPGASEMKFYRDGVQTVLSAPNNPAWNGIWFGNDSVTEGADVVWDYFNVQYGIDPRVVEVSRIEWDGTAAPPAPWIAGGGGFAIDTPSAGFATQSDTGSPQEYLFLPNNNLLRIDGWQIEWAVDVLASSGDSPLGVVFSDDVSSINFAIDSSGEGAALTTGAGATSTVGISPGNHRYMLEMLSGGTTVTLYIDGTSVAALDASSGAGWQGIWFGCDAASGSGADAVWDYFSFS